MVLYSRHFRPLKSLKKNNASYTRNQLFLIQPLQAALTAYFIFHCCCDGEVILMLLLAILVFSLRMELSVVISPDLRPNDKNKNRKRKKNLEQSISGPRPKA